MFRDLIPQLAERFRLVAPDLRGFGQSDMPARSAFTYTFENLASVIDRFTEASASIVSQSMYSTMGHP
jgi:pimeloyl-ACP methyl ester carboxylesterase